MTKEQAVVYLRFSGFSDEQIKAIEGAFSGWGSCVPISEKAEGSEDAISRQAVLNGLASIAKAKARSDAQKALMGRIMFFTEKLPPVNPQKSICPSAGIDCEDCPAYEDTISRKAVIDTLERMDKALDEDRTVENYKELLRECYKALPSVKPKSEWQQDHEILKAYSDGANNVLDKIRAEIEELAKPNEFGGRGNGKSVRYGLCKALEIIDKYAEEDEA